MRTARQKAFVGAATLVGVVAWPNLFIPDFIESVRAAFREIGSPDQVRAEDLSARDARAKEIKAQILGLNDVPADRPGDAGPDAKATAHKCLSHFRTENRLDIGTELSSNAEGKVHVNMGSMLPYQYHEVTLDLPACVRARLVETQKDYERAPLPSAMYAVKGGLTLAFFSIVAGIGGLVSGGVAYRLTRPVHRRNEDQAVSPS